MKTKHLIATTILFSLVFSACGNDRKTVQTTEEPAAEVLGSPISQAEEPAQQTVQTKEPKPEKNLEDFDPLDFFKDVVYCGDSCMNFYKWEGNSSAKPKIFGKLDSSVWLASNSNAVRYAIHDVSELSRTEKTYVPKHKGEPCNLWDVIPGLNKNRIVMFFGLNDIVPSGTEEFIDNYVTLIEHLKEVVPDAKFYILSITPMRKDKQVEGKLCTSNINKANAALVKMCADHGWTYVDVAEKLRDENGHILPQYSDGTNVHLTKAAYALWDEALENLAREELRKEYYEEK